MQYENIKTIILKRKWGKYEPSDLVCGNIFLGDHYQEAMFEDINDVTRVTVPLDVVLALPDYFDVKYRE